ncbi:DUF58 domain-containing protein [Halopseudomonas pachastrellae]|nr:DUF58 domain-containing protein [Halopseudomonas pachastrellae]
MSAAVDPAIHSTLESLLATRRHCHELPLFSRPVRNSRQTVSRTLACAAAAVDFDQVRAYLPGDDIRNIDWRVTARSQKVIPRYSTRSASVRYFLIGEQSPRLFLGSQRCFKSVLAAETCALIAWTALAHHDRWAAWYSALASATKYGPGAIVRRCSNCCSCW